MGTGVKPTGPGLRPHQPLRSGVVVAVLFGLLAEAVETAHLALAGMVTSDWRLRAALAGAYGGAAALAYLGACGLTRSPRRRLTLAVAGASALLALPILNFEYLPAFRSWSSLTGNGAALAVVVAFAVVVARAPRAAALAAVGLVGVLHLWSGGGGGGAVVGHDAARRAGRSPNVVLIVVDTLRADHLSAYGYGRRTSPAFDRLAASGVLFERAHAQAPWTKPSVASLLTGTFAHRHGAVSMRAALAPGVPTLAERLRAHGYRTVAFSASPFITPEFRFDRGFERFDSQESYRMQFTGLYRLVARSQKALRPLGVTVRIDRWLLHAAGGVNPSNAERDRMLADAVMQWVRSHRDAPFFLYAHFIGPHDPYDPPAPYVERFGGAAVDGAPARKRPPAPRRSVFDRAQPLDETERARMITQYDAAIAYVDERIGEIAAVLAGLGLLDETLLVITADHGEEFYEHGNWLHVYQLYDEVVRVPLLFHFPTRLAPGRRPAPAMLVDVFPTVLALLGLPPGVGGSDGCDLFATAPPTAPVFAEYSRHEGGSYLSRMVLRGQFKLIETRDEGRRRHRIELYDLGTDPDEQRDLWTERAAEAAELQALLAGFASGAAAVPASVVDINPATMERLRALGY